MIISRLCLVTTLLVGSLAFACSADPASESEPTVSPSEDGLKTSDHAADICAAHDGPSSCHYCATRSQCETCCSHQGAGEKSCLSQNQCSTKPSSAITPVLSPVRAVAEQASFSTAD
jgi:hypothetical protein